MSTITVSQHVAAPVDRVWALLTDVPGRAEWLSTAGAVEPVTPPPFAAGTVWRETHRMPDGADATEEYRVLACEPRHRFVLGSPGEGAAYETAYTLAPVTEGRHRGGTLVTVDQEGHAEGGRARILELVLGGLATRTAEGALRQELADLARAAAHPGGDADGDATAA
ncbi:hypothetical protein GCM10010123_29840 [Pilimelia anulata]|uniref:Uncharacterized protein n=1 Tax=Pilimelia anulata TaxID=53371 RepID=A0A8J3BAZ8_9ACTN|nr:SRPBCC family protein [Pilimelia anulata]GGJ97797.1 hypothetical protein GCM10010123_29840 [Pilimelia anulata]